MSNTAGGEGLYDPYVKRGAESEAGNARTQGLQRVSHQTSRSRRERSWRIRAEAATRRG